ncbi:MULTISPECIES: primase-like DNA-binding domain-containing protein [unclassified Pantoea]|uniref:primase-like DNA-binding domain-containing protein n=1 Tax=unclassified Pantoea TaxID=2630326 RepID=UPI001CC1DDC3|nr:MULTISPECIES: primase-like DNA-binding domain-containing protein [unclassified Pantoea]
MKSFSQALESILLEFRLNYLKRRTKSGIQTNLYLTDDNSADWLQKCDEATAA